MVSKQAANGEIFNLLKQIGLNQYESRIYVSLLASGTLSAGELAGASNVPRSRVYDVLSSLEKKGFAMVQIGRPIKYRAVPVEGAVGQVRSSYEDEFSQKLSFISKLEKDLNAAVVPHLEKRKKAPLETDNIAGVLRGKNNLYGHIKHLISSSNERVLKITGEAGLANLEKHCKQALEKARKKGVRMRIVTNAPDLKNAGRLSDYAQIRSHKDVSGSIFVKDREDVVLMTNLEDTGIWIKSPYLAECLENLFMHAWEKGRPLSE